MNFFCATLNQMFCLEPKTIFSSEASTWLDRGGIVSVFEFDYVVVFSKSCCIYC
jgi:hypothetical protein